MHWADSFLSSRKGDQVISTGISPSGPIHVGNMREILTGDIVYRAARKLGMKSRFLYLCDDIDPLRRVYPFLKPEYSEHVGKPLYRIPSPDGNGTYAQHYVAPFLDSLKKLEVDVEVIYSSELYASGKFYEYIRKVIEEREKIASILEEVSGRKIGRGWFPYSPLCAKCGKINSAIPFSFEDPYVNYECNCGHTGKSDIRRDEGKMPWRVEWPAKWALLGVTIEPIGKDHGAAGGAFESSKRIASEIFGVPGPDTIVYERVMWKGRGPMHSSTGVAIEISEALKFTPEEALRFFIAKGNPGRHLDFDPGLGLLSLTDDCEKYFNAYSGTDSISDPDFREIVEYSGISGFHGPIEPSFRHLATIVQIYSDSESILRSLSRGGREFSVMDKNLEERIDKVKYWLENFAPDMVKFGMLPKGTRVELSGEEKRVLERFLDSVTSAEWDAQKIHDLVYLIASEESMDPPEVFRVFYRVLIGKDRGPRLGFFLSSMDRRRVTERLRECI